VSIWERYPKAELVALEMYKGGETSITEICRQLRHIYKEDFSYNQVRHKLNGLLVEEQLDVLQMLSSKKGRSSSGTKYFRDCI